MVFFGLVWDEGMFGLFPSKVFKFEFIGIFFVAAGLLLLSSPFLDNQSVLETCFLTIC